jgi:hypothetical protein
MRSKRTLVYMASAVAALAIAGLAGVARAQVCVNNGCLSIGAAVAPSSVPWSTTEWVSMGAVAVGNDQYVVAFCRGDHELSIATRSNGSWIQLDGGVLSSDLSVCAPAGSARELFTGVTPFGQVCEGIDMLPILSGGYDIAISVRGNSSTQMSAVHSGGALEGSYYLCGGDNAQSLSGAFGGYVTSYGYFGNDRLTVAYDGGKMYGGNGNDVLSGGERPNTTCHGGPCTDTCTDCETTIECD